MRRQGSLSEMPRPAARWPSQELYVSGCAGDDGCTHARRGRRSACVFQPGSTLAGAVRDWEAQRAGEVEALLSISPRAGVDWLTVLFQLCERVSGGQAAGGQVVSPQYQVRWITGMSDQMRMAPEVLRSGSHARQDPVFQLLCFASGYLARGFVA